MTMPQDWVSPQCLETAQRALAAECTPVLEFLRRRMFEQFGASLRDYAELREAKSLISIIKYPGFEDRVRAQDIAWALLYVRDAFVKSGLPAPVLFIEKATRLMELNLKAASPMPAHLAHRITNELALLNKAEVAAVA